MQLLMFWCRVKSWANDIMRENGKEERDFEYHSLELLLSSLSLLWNHRKSHSFASNEEKHFWWNREERNENAFSQLIQHIRRRRRRKNKKKKVTHNDIMPSSLPFSNFSHTLLPMTSLDDTLYVILSFEMVLHILFIIQTDEEIEGKRERNGVHSVMSLYRKLQTARGSFPFALFFIMRQLPIFLHRMHPRSTQVCHSRLPFKKYLSNRIQERK